MTEEKQVLQNRKKFSELHRKLNKLFDYYYNCFHYNNDWTVLDESYPGLSSLTMRYASVMPRELIKLVIMSFNAQTGNLALNNLKATDSFLNSFEIQGATVIDVDFKERNNRFINVICLL